MTLDVRSRSPEMDRPDDQGDPRGPYPGSSRVMRVSLADGPFATPRRRASQPSARRSPRPPTPPTSRFRRMAALGVTLGALIFLAAVLAWPLLVWLLSLAGIVVPSLCI